MLQFSIMDLQTIHKRMKINWLTLVLATQEVKKAVTMTMGAFRIVIAFVVV